MWEIPALAIINELRSRAALKRLWAASRSTSSMRAPRPSCGPRSSGCAQLPDLRISDFGTRRRHSFLWQRWCVEALKEGLGEAFIGTSNVLLAMDNDLEAIGTNAHELPMVLRRARHGRRGRCAGALPGAAGLAALLRRQPADRAARRVRHGRASCATRPTGWRTGRASGPTARPPIEGGEQIIAWWRERGRDPRDKLLVFSDALDVDTIEEAYRHFDGRVRMSFGWGTNLTNDFAGCAPKPNAGLKAISLVCKVSEANGRPAVKLSDNPHKATGDPARSRAICASSAMSAGASRTC